MFASLVLGSSTTENEWNCMLSQQWFLVRNGRFTSAIHDSCSGMTCQYNCSLCVLERSKPPLPVRNFFSESKKDSVSLSLIPVVRQCLQISPPDLLTILTSFAITVRNQGKGSLCAAYKPAEVRVMSISL